MKRFVSTLIVLFALLPMSAFAQEVGVVEKSPPFFYLLEIAGILIAIIAIWFSKKAEKKFGGLVGNMLRMQTVALFSIAVSLAFRASMELMGGEGFFWEVSYEIPLYVALILISVGSWKLAQGADRAMTKST